MFEKTSGAIAELFATVGILHRLADDEFAAGNINFDAYLYRIAYLKDVEDMLMGLLDTVENEERKQRH